jgi:hypothetical protein
MQFDDEGTLMAQYIRRRPELSWHIVRTHTRAFDGYIAVCGKRITTRDTAVDLPGTGKSCESCLRITRRRTDLLPEDDGSTQPELVP